MYKFRNMYNTNQLVYVYVPEMENKKKKERRKKKNRLWFPKLLLAEAA